MQWIATAAFALEGIVARELRDMGAQNVEAQNGAVRFEGDMTAGLRANLWLRCCDRVLLEMGRFEARTFDELFEAVRAIEWEALLPVDAAFPVRAKCVRSQLMSPSDCQKIVKKAVAERLKSCYGGDWLSETGPVFAIDCAIHSDKVEITLDSSGVALNRRGYRTWNGEAPLRETLAAALVKLMPWRPDAPLLDPCCGTGTILCEAAMIATDRAPGLNRDFAMEIWPALDKQASTLLRDDALERFHAHDNDALDITGVDIDPDALDLARKHVRQCGFNGRISLINTDMRDWAGDCNGGAILANPPYGERLGDRRAADAVARALGRLAAAQSEAAMGVITSNANFEREFGRRADKRRRLYNGRLECEFLMYDRASFRARRKHK